MQDMVLDAERYNGNNTDNPWPHDTYGCKTFSYSYKYHVVKVQGPIKNLIGKLF